MSSSSTGRATVCRDWSCAKIRRDSLLQQSAHPSLPSAVFGISSLLAALVCVIEPETLNRELVEHIDDIDTGPLLRRCLNSKKVPLLGGHWSNFRGTAYSEA